MSVFLQSISVVQFKNYNQATFQFDARVVGICGRNGVGKTNLLDAIHYLCFTKSYFSSTDAINVQKGQNGFRIEGAFLLDQSQEKAICILRETGKKEFILNEEVYSRFSQHLGRYPCVVISPDDVKLVIGGSEERRKFLDVLIGQLDAGYIGNLIAYNRILQQRNSFLRAWNDGTSRDLAVLDILDQQLAEKGQAVFEKRRNFLSHFLPAAQGLYKSISGQPEQISIYYDSELHHASFEELLAASRQKDLVLQRTAAGIHKDDLKFLLEENPFKTTASQGQRKSLLFALKLAEVERIRMEKGFPPLLLLDDVFEKLDEERISNLLSGVCSDKEMQVFITDTSCERLSAGLLKIGQQAQIISIK